MSSIIRNVNELKQSLSKELQGGGLASHKENSDRCADILSQLDAEAVTLQVLTETLVGTVVSKFKSHEDPSIAAQAKALVKKWKQLAKQSGLGRSPSASASTSAAKNTPSKAKTPSSSSKSAATNGSNSSSTETPTPLTEWDYLPPLRKNTANKFHQTFQLSSESLISSGIHTDALTSLTISRATEVENACHDFAKGAKNPFLSKVRSLIFNLKKNTSLRENVLLGATTAETLVKLSTEELATAEKNEERSKMVGKLKDSRRLDWEQANENKINDMCGIKGELLTASLFTCGRCKSTKTTMYVIFS